MSIKVILKLGDAAGTSITLQNTSLEQVEKEFSAALAEQRLMDVGMNTPGYAHKINPYQVTFVQTLDY